MHTVIIEDEPQAAAALRLLVDRYCPGLNVVGVASSFSEGYRLCQDLQPGLVFCDIRLNSAEGSGMDLARLLSDRKMKVIFVTGTKAYAAEAFRVNAIDYLLKPVRIKELTEAVDKVLQQPAGKPTATGHLHLPSKQGVLLIPFETIVRCEADSAYTHFYIAGKPGRQTVSINLGRIAAQLPAEQFFRVHKTHLINRAHILSYRRGDEGMARMTDHCEVPIARPVREAFIRWLQ